MDLTEAIAQSTQSRPSGNLCKLGEHIKTALDVGEGELLIELLKTKAAEDVALILAKTQYKIGSTLVKLHRSGRCGCFR